MAVTAPFGMSGPSLVTPVNDAAAPDTDGIAAALIEWSSGPGGVSVTRLAEGIERVELQGLGGPDLRAAVSARLSVVAGQQLANELDGSGPLRLTIDVGPGADARGSLFGVPPGLFPEGGATRPLARPEAGVAPLSAPRPPARPDAAAAPWSALRPQARPVTPEAPMRPEARPAPTDPEGFDSFVEGAVLGDFSENSSWSTLAGQIVGGLNPLADLRDIAANVNHVRNGRPGGWIGLGTAVVGAVPLAGDALKSVLRAGGRAAGAATETGEQLVRRSDEVVPAAADAAGAVTRTLVATVGRNSAEWVVDAQGRPSSVSATLSELRPSGTPRGADELAAQDLVRSRGIELDDAGHVIGHRFMGDQGVSNMFPQNLNFNRGAYKTMENEWAAWIDHGATVRTRVELSGGTPDRPAQVGVSYDVFDDTGRLVYSNQDRFSNAGDQTFTRVSTDEIRRMMGA